MSLPSATVLKTDQLKPDPKQPRKTFPDESMAELAQSIREKGVRVPLIVRPENGVHLIEDGERRWRAAQLAELSELPCIVRAAEVDRGDLLEDQLVENVQRENLNPMDLARAIHDLVENHGRHPEQIADRIGKARPTIYNLMRLVKMPPAGQELLAAGEISQATARTLATVANIDADVAAKAAENAKAAATGDSRYSPTDIVESAFSQATEEMTSRNTFFAPNWLGSREIEREVEYFTSDVNRNGEPKSARETVTLRACKNCPLHIQRDGRRYCGNVVCLWGKNALRQEQVADQLSKKFEIPVAGEDENVTIIKIDYNNEKRVLKMFRDRAAHLRIVPEKMDGWDAYHTQYVLRDEILGVDFVSLGTVTPSALRKNASTSTQIPDDASGKEKARLRQKVENERRQRRLAKGKFRRAKADVTWLLDHVAEAIAPQLKIQLPTIRWVDAFVEVGTRNNMSDLRDRYDEYRAQLPKQPTQAQHAFMIALAVLYAEVSGYSVQPEQLYQLTRANKACQVVAERLGAKLAKGWDEIPIHETDTNCHHCGRFLEAEKMTKTALKRGWAVTDKGVVSCSTKQCREALGVEA